MRRVALALVLLVGLSGMGPQLGRPQILRYCSPSRIRAETPANGSAWILELYPNPVADGNYSEYRRMFLAAPSNWSLTEGHTVARILAVAAGQFVVSTAPEATRERVNDPVVLLAGRARLANNGDRARLPWDSRLVDAVVYGRAGRKANTGPTGWRRRRARGRRRDRSTESGSHTAGSLSRPPSSAILTAATPRPTRRRRRRARA